MGVLHLDQMIAAVVFVGARIAGMMTFAPFLGSEGISLQVKAGFTVALTALLYPVSGVVGLESDLLGWVRVAVGEAVIGLLLGLILQCIFEAAQVAGQIVGIQTGFSLVTILDPQSQADTPVLTIFHQLLVLLIFIRLGVDHWLLRGLAASFAYLPPGRVFSGPALRSALLHEAGLMWLVGLEIAAPVLAATFLVDVALGFLGKASPQLPVVFVGISLKTLLGLMVLAGTLTLWPRLFERRFSEALILGERVLHLAR
jgi:flagellar biosynthetic protein FliR